MDSLPFFVSHTWFHVDQDRHELELQVRHHGRLFYLNYHTDHFVRSPSVREMYLKCLQALKDEVDDEDADVDERDALIWFLKPFEPMVLELAAPQSRIKPPTLSDYVFPEFHVCQLQAVDDELHPVRIDTEDTGWMPPGLELETEDIRDLESWTRLYEPSQITLSYVRSEDALVKPPGRIQLSDGNVDNDTYYFFKSFWDFGSLYELKRELATLKQIANSDIKADVSRLHGVVRTEDRVLGLLLTWIDAPKGALQYQYWRRSLQARLRWAAQIRDTVAELHKNGVVWGDAKLDNVLLDKNDTPWVVDFGGGHTPNWVDRDKAETVEGDLQGLEKIVERLSRATPSSDLSSSTES